MFDEKKYRILVHKYKNSLYNYAFLMLHNDMDADDIVQEALIRLWKNFESIKFFSAHIWIFRTTHNLCIDSLRRKKVNLFREIELEENLAESSASVGPEKQLVDKELAENVRKKIFELKEPERSVFILYHYEQIKYSGISEILSIPENSVKVYLHRARKTLHNSLKCYV